MSVTLSLNTHEFRQAMREYVAATGKDGAEALRRQGKNYAIHCIQALRKAKGASAIRALQNESWWAKFIAKVIGKQAGATAAREAFQAQYSAAQKKIRDAAGRKGAWKLDRKESSYAKYARAMSKKILGKRVSAISFLAFFFKSMALQLGKSAPGKTFSGFTTVVQQPAPNRLALKMDAAYAFRKRGTKTSTSSERILQDAMNRAIPMTIQDMRDYTAKKLAERSRQYSGRAA